MPETPWGRSVAGGRTAARVGGKVLRHLARKPFLSRDRQRGARESLRRETAETLFQGLSLLKGTALKLAQLLSLEMDLLPPELCRELEKSYNQVPPLNRPLVRKVVQQALGAPPEERFRSFELTAFAAASLGQVHRAVSRTGDPLAVKIQYPGISKTIHSDLRIVRAAFRPFKEYDLLRPAFAEIEARLLEETDYRQEASHASFFAKALEHEAVRVPRVHENLSAETVLTCDFVQGVPLNEWIKGNPPPRERDRVANVLHEVFLKGFYELHGIHADPNPGNFIIRRDLSVGLVDFGCVKRFDPGFVDLYRRLPETALHGGREEYLRLMKALRITPPDMDPDLEDRFFRAFFRSGRWLARLYEEDTFDFGAHPRFMAEGRELAGDLFSLRAHMDINPSFVFLDRTRYGLLRLFEAMEARVRIRNDFECKP